MNTTSSSRRSWVLALFVILTLSLAVFSGCGDDEETIVGIVLGEDVSWTTVANAPTDEVLHDVYFVTTTLGWAVGDNGTILKHVDTGWIAQTSGTSISLRGVHFTDASHGWVVGRSGVYLYTSDGGSTWKIDSTYIVCEAGVNPIRRNLNGIYFNSPTSGWATAEGGNLYKWTTDSACANSFNVMDTVIDPSAVDTAVDSLIDTIVYAVDSVDTTVWFPDSVIYDTIWDSTITWDIDTVLTPFVDTTITLDSVINLDYMSGFYLIADYLFQDIWDVHFADATNGWAVGVYGTIYNTVDGGATWTAQKSRTTQTLRSVKFVSPTTGWVVGHNGTILHTNDGGETWVQQFDNNGISSHFVGVEFPDVSNGWVIATDGSVYRTADGGRSWVVDLEGSEHALNGISFVDATTGWVVGFDGEIIQATKK